MKGVLILDVTARGSTILKLLARCVKTLLIWGIEIRCQSFGKDLHAFTLSLHATSDETPSKSAGDERTSGASKSA
eukprot:4838137-Karenia_brevis.AAC.1